MRGRFTVEVNVSNTQSGRNIFRSECLVENVADIPEVLRQCAVIISGKWIQQMSGKTDGAALAARSAAGNEGKTGVKKEREK